MLVDGVEGLHLETLHSDGRPLRVVAALAVDGGRVTGVFHQLNPEKLGGLPPLAAEDRWPPRW